MVVTPCNDPTHRTNRMRKPAGIPYHQIEACSEHQFTACHGNNSSDGTRSRNRISITSFVAPSVSPVIPPNHERQPAHTASATIDPAGRITSVPNRSEERRVGKEC